MSNQYQILTRPRHFRYMFFVEHDYPYEKVASLVNTNLRYWGGRYNPIIPVNNNKISQHYRNLIAYFDPDTVFYSNQIDPSVLKQLRLFNPIEYANLDETVRRVDIRGVESAYLLSRFDKNRSVMLPKDVWQTESPLLNFYKINFGLESSLNNVDNELTKNFKRLWISKGDLNSVNRIIVEERPINASHLCKLNINTKVLRATDGLAQYDEFEIVISKDKTAIDDLLYFWNRELFQCRTILYMTLEELEILCADKYFGELLYQACGEHGVKVVSYSLTESEIKSIIADKLQPVMVRKRFTYKHVTKFPFDILDDSGLYEREYGEEISFQSLQASGGLVQIPKLSFTDKVEFYPQEWIIDFETRIGSKAIPNSVYYPTTSNGYIGGLRGRINKRGNISGIINNQLNTSPVIETGIPDFIDVARQLIQRPFIDGEFIDSKYVSIRYSDQSHRLMAFIRLFNEDLHAINEYFTDKFWVDIFEKLSTSDKPAGDAISFLEIKVLCVSALNENGIVLGKRDETRHNEENLSIGLKMTLKELCSYKLFLKGFKLKCRHCSSIHWYHVEDVGEVVECRGCLQMFNLPVEPEFSYKLNDLVKNNMYQTRSHRDGNLAVVRTLASLKESARGSFEYTPQLNLYTDHYSTKPESDVDIFCSINGVLVIGEAKHTSAAFFEESMKSLKSLVELSKQIRPGKVLLSCYEDTNGKLAKAKQSLVHLFNKWEFIPEIETIALHSPDYFNLDSYRYFYH